MREVSLRTLPPYFFVESFDTLRRSELAIHFLLTVYQVIRIHMPDEYGLYNHPYNDLNSDKHYEVILCHSYWELSGKYLAILNISRTGRMALMWLGIHSEKTLMCVREQSLSRGASQSAVRRRWLSLCPVWPSHSHRASRSASSRQCACPFYGSRAGFFGKASHQSAPPPTAQIWLHATYGFSQS
jgi:hypothetical protein